MPLKNREVYISSTNRIYNRIRSPGLVASGRWTKVSQGSRQKGSATLGKGMALRIECEKVFLTALTNQTLPMILNLGGGLFQGWYKKNRYSTAFV